MSDQTTEHERVSEARRRALDDLKFFDKSWTVACKLVDYFDSYRLSSFAPVAAEIEVALAEAYQQGLEDQP